MKLINGKTYRFESRADIQHRSLNVYGIFPRSLANVCLYTSNDDDICQQWIYVEDDYGKYLLCKGDTHLALDLYTGFSYLPKVMDFNAHVYSPSYTSCIEIETSSDHNPDYIQVKLKYYTDKYLTCNQNSNGTSMGKGVNSSGNVYWYEGGLTDFSQDWKPILLDDEPSIYKNGLDCYALGYSAESIEKTLTEIVAGSTNISFIGRYYSANRYSGKILRPSEAMEISKRGIDIISIYQDLNNKPEYFGIRCGTRDAKLAYDYARYEIGQPEGSAIYFAVDFDATDKEIECCIVPYFVAVRNRFENTYGGYYKVGVYGSGAVCQMIKQELNLASYSWLAQSTGYNGTKEYNSPEKYDIKQGMEYPRYNGIVFDDDISGNSVDFGQWSLR